MKDPITEGLHDLPLERVQSWPNNPRKSFDETDLTDLIASVKEKGVLEPILVRPNGKHFEIIAGERRTRAATAAGLKTIPAIVRPMSDADALEANLTEQLMRADLHALDEAAALKLHHEATGLDYAEMARRIGKGRDKNYVTRRIQLVDLIEPAAADFRAGLITLGHALELCRYSPDIQAAGLNECYNQRHQRDEEGNWRNMPEKDSPRTVAQLQQWIGSNILLNLAKAPFKTTDPNLRPDGLTCLECPLRTGFNRGLFADIKNDDICTNPICYQSKVQTFIQITRTKIEEKAGKPTPIVNAFHSQLRDYPEALNPGQYRKLEKKETCEFAQKAVMLEHEKLKTVTVCIEPTCKDHLGRYQQSSNSDPGAKAKSVAEHRRRKQELLNIKVAEETRRRIFALSLPGFKSLDRDWLQRIAYEFFIRIPSTDEKVILIVMGVDTTEPGWIGMQDRSKIKSYILGMTDRELTRFLALCAFGHYGENPYGATWKDQSQVTEFAAERELDYRLVDAEVRVALSTKKTLPAHTAYLEAVKAGKKAEPPKVFEEVAPTGKSAKKTATKKPAKKAGKVPAKKAKKTPKKAAKKPGKRATKK